MALVSVLQPMSALRSGLGGRAPQTPRRWCDRGSHTPGTIAPTNRPCTQPGCTLWLFASRKSQIL